MALLGPLFFAAVFVLPTLLASRGGVRQIVVVDATTGPVGARGSPTSSTTARCFARSACRRAASRRFTHHRSGAEAARGFLIVTTPPRIRESRVPRANVSGFATVGALERTIGEVERGAARA